eukprot:NODE_9487_length_639_cov_520.042636_g9221_i0.p1 GENE.NODE_9487_length_639_cov_520.042636_g9221_i0~~NODE_9487_length_639_cov_520.042636_g9221_i0.p1  ORF type:complete len:158 (+),score=43.46 NODE_9487_length_639_cov_520.042636_g9221_i0:57-530(+)
MNKLILLACLLVAVAAKDVAISFDDCGNAATIGHITNLTWSPNPAHTGSEIATVLTGSLKSAVTAAPYKLVVKLNGIPVFHHDGKMCGKEVLSLPLGLGTLNMNLLDCPAAAGALTMHIGVMVSNAVPDSKVVLAVTANDQTGAPLLCANVNAQFSG